MMATETLRDPHAAGDLTALCEILNEWANAIAYDDEITDYPGDLTSLPTFGGNEPQDTTEVWSWNETHMLVDGPQITAAQSGWDIVARCTVCGEAWFHCDHEEQ